MKSKLPELRWTLDVGDKSTFGEIIEQLNGDKPLDEAVAEGRHVLIAIQHSSMRDNPIAYRLRLANMAA